MKDFATIATQYARDVVESRLIACKWVRLACQRHLNDLKRAEDGWIYQFNPEIEGRITGKVFRPVDRVCRFAEKMPHVKGDWAGRGQLIRLETWEIFVLASAFGWINSETKRRRFRQVDLVVPRKNAKSTIASVIGNYMLTADEEFGAEVYSGATSQDQAYEVFRPAFLMARAAPDFRSHYGVLVPSARMPKNMSVMSTNSKFEPVIGKPGDGASPSCGIVDEYHEHKTPELYETLATGMGARSQPILLMITTAGDNIGGPCYMHQQELQKILAGVNVNEQRFGIIYTIDEEDDWTSPEALIKANPNYGISVDAEFLQAAQADAIVDASKQNTFKKKHLNKWVNAASPWINVEALQRGGDAGSLEDFLGEECFEGLDLASKQDIASDVKLFVRELDGEEHYYVFSRNYLPQAAAQKPENATFATWVNQGHLIQTPGNMIDLKQIAEHLSESAHRHVIVEIAMDSWGSREIAPSLQDEGFVVVDVPMMTKYLSEPMKKIAAMVEGGRFHHDGNPAFVWMFSNVEVFEDRNENIFPRKSKADKKIDAAVATIIAVGRAMLRETRYGKLDDFLANPLAA